MTAEEAGASLLDGLRVLELGRGLAAAVCGNVFAGLGADVVRAGDAPASPVDAAISAGKRLSDAAAHEVTRLAREADLVVVASGEGEAGLGGFDLDGLRRDAAGAVVVAITPFGLSGPYRDFAGGDLVAFHGSGIARLLIGPVAEPEQEPPVRAAGEQSQFIAGVTAACASMHALYGREGSGEGQLIDVSVQEALACMAIRDLAHPAYDETPESRKRAGFGSTIVTILPASDGQIAISPREAHQWKAWVGVMGEPEWARDGQFDDREVKVARWGELHALMSQWSSQHTKAEIFEAGQGAHVPCFPLSTPADLLQSPQLEHRRSFRSLTIDGKEVRAPGLPFGFAPGAEGTAEGGDGTAEATDPVRPSQGVAWRERSAPAVATPADLYEAPLRGVRVLDFSWVIAGPTCTRYLAAMGAEVIKVESGGRPDPGRASELHSVLGQGKRGIALNLRTPEAVAIARRLVEQSDVVVENFATGVMGRLGLGDDVLFELRPDLVLVSASGMGRTGPQADRVAYGTLLQCFTGFAAMNGYPDRPPAIGMAWLDPMCGLLMASAAVAALRERRRSGRGRRIDFSMVEALLWTMPGPLLDYQLSGRVPERAGNDDPRHSPHGVYGCAGDDQWLAVAVTSDEQWRALCSVIAGLDASWALDQRRAHAEVVDAAIGGWAAGRAASEAWLELQRAGVPAAPANSSLDLFADRHLRERGFYRLGADVEGVERLLPGLPWQLAGVDAPQPQPAPGLGADTDAVLREVLELGDEELAALHSAGALE